MEFYKRMEIVCGRIPYGKVVSYGQIALLCGAPRNARQVGYALSHRQMGRVPAHRIVNAKGFLSGAASFETAGQQRFLLEQEGISVSADNRVDLKRDGWKNNWEEVEELGELFARLGI